MQGSRACAGKDQLATEEIHLNLAALPPAVVDDPVLPNRRRFGRTGGIDLQGGVLRAVVAQRGVPKLVTNQKRPCERVARVVVADGPVARIEMRAAAGQDGTSRLDRFDIETSVGGDGRDDVDRVPRVRAIRDGRVVKGSGALPREFDGVHRSVPRVQQLPAPVLRHPALLEQRLEGHPAPVRARRVVGLIAEAQGQPRRTR